MHTLMIGPRVFRQRFVRLPVWAGRLAPRLHGKKMCASLRLSDLLLLFFRNPAPAIRPAPTTAPRRRPGLDLHMKEACELITTAWGSSGPPVPGPFYKPESGWRKSARRTREAEKEISYGLRVQGNQVLKAEISPGREEAIKRGRKGKR